MQDLSEFPVEQTPLYKFAMMLYREYKASEEHEYTPAMAEKIAETIAHLELDVYQIENQLVISYVLDKGAVDANSA